jgi:hypothetical protein
MPNPRFNSKQTKAPYSVSYLFPAPPKITNPKGKLVFDPEYVARIKQVFSDLHNIRARAAFYAIAAHWQILGVHPELESIMYNAPPHWDDKTLTATEEDGTVIERFIPNPDTAGEA